MKQIQAGWMMVIDLLLFASVVTQGRVGCRCNCQSGICTCTCGDPNKMYSNANSDLREIFQHPKSDEAVSIQSRVEPLENTNDERSERYKEPLIPVEPINDTKLYTGIAYRLYHESFGRSPVVVAATYEGLEVRWDSSEAWSKVPFMVLVERRQSEWPKYISGGSHEYYALFMLIKSGSNYQLINVAASGMYPGSTVCFWAFYHWHTNPTTSSPNSKYCVDEPSRCAFIINRGDCTWGLQGSGRLYRLTANGGRYPGPLGFQNLDGNPRMGEYKTGLITQEGNLVPEMAGSQLTGTIISFKIEQKPLQNLQQVTMLHAYDIINNSSKSITEIVVINKTIIGSCTFQFSQSMKGFAALAVKEGIPLGVGAGTAPSPRSMKREIGVSTGIFDASVEIESSLDVSVTANQQWTTTTTDIFSINQAVEIPAFRKLTVNGNIQFADKVELRFVSQILVTMSNVRVTRYSRVAVKVPIPRPQLKAYLVKHVEGRIIQDTEEGVLFETEGTLKGSFGIDSLLHLNESPVVS